MKPVDPGTLRRAAKALLERANAGERRPVPVPSRVPKAIAAVVSIGDLGGGGVEAARRDERS